MQNWDECLTESHFLTLTSVGWPAFWYMPVHAFLQQVKAEPYGIPTKQFPKLDQDKKEAERDMVGRDDSEVLHLNLGWSCFLPSTHLILYSSSLLKGFTYFQRLCFSGFVPVSHYFSGMKCFFLYFEWLVLAHLLKPSSVITSSWKLSVSLQGLPSFESLSDFLSSIKEVPYGFWCPIDNTHHWN